MQFTQKITEFLASPQGRGQIRHVATIIGGFLVLRGTIPQDMVDYINTHLDGWADSIGGVMTLAAMLHSWMDKPKQS